MDFNRSKAIDYFLEEISSGRLEFSQMRKMLQEKGVEKDEVNVVVRQVDHELQRIAQLKMIRSQGRALFWGGLILASVGLIITVATYSGWIALNNALVLAYGPVGVGLAMAAAGRAQMKRGAF